MFELGNESEPEFSVSNLRIEHGSVYQLSLCFRTDGYIHFSDSRARAIASAAGIIWTRPLSISEIRRSTSAAQASSISASSSRLAINRSASRARSGVESLRA